MMKWLLLVIFCGALALFFWSPTPEPEEPEDIRGLWKSRDQNSDKPRSLVAIYKYGDLYYGRMLATYDDLGNIKDTILEKKDRASGVIGNPPYCGMDFVYNVKKEENDGEENPRYRGKVIDPQKGKTYNIKLWLEGDILIFRGEIWIFGKNIPWSKASKEDLPKGFSMKDIKKFAPEVPQAK